MRQYDVVTTDPPQSNIFDLSHSRAYSTEIGRLTPILCIEAVPSDKFSIKIHNLIRFAPLISPFMGQMTCHTHLFFVANRLLWINWEDFITGFNKIDLAPNTSVPPFISLALDLNLRGTLLDYMGLPVEDDSSADLVTEISAMPLMAYQLIWQQYYRNQHMSDQVVTSELTDGEITNPLAATLGTLRQALYGNDLFTSCLPDAQLGPDVILPLGTTAPINAVLSTSPATNQQTFRSVTSPFGAQTSQTGVTTDAMGDIRTQPADTDMFLDLGDSHEVDLANATGATIIDFRRAKALQRYYELAMKGGNRYFEWLKVYYNVAYSNKSAQRAMLFGAQKQPVKVSSITQTAQPVDAGTTPQTPLGTAVGEGISVGSGKTHSIYCEEHGFIIGIMYVAPRPLYQKGVNKMWIRKDRFDYHTPHLEHIGEEEVLKMEIFSVNHFEDDFETFGYQTRYYSYKGHQDSVHGDFRASLDSYTLARKFASIPSLNETFVTIQTSDYDRLFALENPAGEDRLWCSTYLDIEAKRPMAIFATDKI